MSFCPERCTLGIEFGSTRIKAVLIGPRTTAPLAQGDYTWENRLENGVWTYPESEIWAGLQAAYAALAADVQARFGQPLTTVGCLGVSAMMHGYLAFDENDALLVPFPHLAQHDHRPGSRSADRGVRLQHPAAVEHRAPVPGDAEQRGTPAAAALFHNAGRVRALEADRPQGAGRGRRFGHVPDRQRRHGL